MFKQTGIGSFVTLSNEKGARDVTINKNETPQKTCNTDIPSTSTTITTETSSHSATPKSLEKLCQPDPEAVVQRCF